jgi:alkylation response protein AidB-like acyl-CoA dehydrogenase
VDTRELVFENCGVPANHMIGGRGVGLRQFMQALASEAVQIHGGYGYTDEFVAPRFFRDAKILQIGEGTNEIQRLVIARLLGC